MSLIEAIVLGIVQGLTAFLPISSTGHLRIVPAFVGWDDPGSAFTAVIQLGTTIAVLIYFRQDLWRIAKAWVGSLRQPTSERRSFDAHIGWFIVIGTIPIGIFGLIFKDQIENGARSLYLIGAALIVFGLVMLAAERVARQERGIESMTARDGLLVGIAQALALVLSALFELKGVATGDSHTDASAFDLIVSTILAFVVGYWSIAFLLRFVARHSLGAFVAYRLALGVLVLALVAGGAIS